jgi:hypothetical protein
METKKLSLRDRLGKLFTSSVVYRPKGKGKTVIIDPSKFMSSGASTSTKSSDRYGRVYSTLQAFAGQGHGSMFNTSDYGTMIQQRVTMFSDYETMDTNSLIASALDIYSDECCTTNERGEVVSISSTDSEIKELLENLFYDILDVDFNLWPWIRNTCKYGDTYLGLNVQEGLGVIGVVPLSSYFMTRIEGSEDNPYDVKFKILNPEISNNTYSGKTVYSKLREESIDTFESFEVAHFRLLSDTNFLPYGKSMLEGIRKDFKILMLLEDAMLLHRIMRSPEKRLFKIDIGNLPENEIDTYMQKIMDGMKKIPHVNEETGQYNLRYNLQNMLEDFYIPVRGDNSGMSIESLPGLEYAPVEDLEFIRSKIFAGLKIPKAFLGYDENISGKSTLAQEDVRFARTIDRIQKMIISELNKIALVHLYSMGIEDQRLTDFKITLTNPSIVYEQEKLELFRQKVDLAASMKDLKMISRDYMYKNIFNFSDYEASYQAEQSIEDIKLSFREAQIENEGNDPKLTKESVGTPWDIANLYVSSKGETDNDIEIEDVMPKDKGGSEKGGQPGAGRPKAKTNTGTDRSGFGRDPLGKRNLIKKTFDYDDKINYKYKGGNPFAFENVNKKIKKEKNNTTLEYFLNIED